MKIVADENIVALTEYFGHLGDLRVLPGREIRAADIRDADALLVRSVTRVDPALLKGSRVQYIGSATSGLDHIDTAWLHAQGIVLRNAAGANARSVVEYVLCALAALRHSGGPDWQACSVGIVGAGHIGGALAKALDALGIAHLIHDPFLDPTLFPQRRRALEEVLAQDIITLHTPLTRQGPHPTYHLLDAARIDALRPGQTLINAARGAVVDNAALLARLRRGDDFYCVLDAWEHEPAIDRALMERVDIATPHIAGYSQDGKRRGTEMIWQGFCETFGLPLVAPAATEGDVTLVLDAGEKRATVAGAAALEPGENRAQVVDAAALEQRENRAQVIDAAALEQRENRAQVVDTAALEQRENRTMVTDAPEKRPAISADVALLGSAENRPTTADALDTCLLAAYDIRADDARLRALARDPEPARGFDLLRKHYPVRREFANFSVRGLEGEARRQAEALGFRT